MDDKIIDINTLRENSCNGPAIKNNPQKKIVSKDFIKTTIALVLLIATMVTVLSKLENKDTNNYLNEECILYTMNESGAPIKIDWNNEDAPLAMANTLVSLNNADLSIKMYAYYRKDKNKLEEALRYINEHNLSSNPLLMGDFNNYVLLSGYQNINEYDKAMKVIFENLAEKEALEGMQR